MRGHSRVPRQLSRALRRALLVCGVGACGLGGSAVRGEAAFTAELQFGTGATIPVAWGDYDRDGDQDLAVGHFGSTNRLFVNDGAGGFTEQVQFGTGATFAVAWADFDNDGDLDLAVGRGNNQQNYLYINYGDGTFSQTAQFGLLRTIAVAWGDADGDGDLDLAVGNGILGVAEQNYLYVNGGNGTFTAVPEFGLGQTCALVWGDCDNDGDLDLAVGNGGFGQEGQNYLYTNNGDGTFTSRPEFGLGDTAALAWGDCDNDGDLDLAVGNWNTTGCALYVNNGDGTFSGHAEFGSHDTNTLAWGDADNDGDLDLATGNGDFTSAEQNDLYINNDDGTFTETAQFGLGSTDGVAWGDSDGDGDLDVAVGNEHTPGQNYLYRNGGDEGPSLIVRLQGRFHDHGAGFSNRDGIGAKVAVFAAGHVGEADQLLGYREVEAHGGFSAQNQIAPHFGLAGHATVDLRITWPGSAGSHQVQDLAGVAVGQSILIEEPVPPAAVDPSGSTGRAGEHGVLWRVTPNPSSGRVRLDWMGPRRPVADLQIHDAAGRLVRRLRASTPSIGRGGATWDGRSADGRPAPGGIYLARLDGGAEAVRLVLVR